MTLSFTNEMIPLTTDVDGVIRIGKTRVTLDTVIAAFSEGATAEEIAQQYPSLDLADVYQILGYCLRRPSEIESYLQDRKTQADDTRRKNELMFDPIGVRDRLLARRTNKAS